MLHIDTLVTSYPDWRVSFSATLPKGEITALIGPSGAGTVSYTHLTLPTNA